MFAASVGARAAVRWLLRHDVSADRRDRCGESALFYAVKFCADQRLMRDVVGLLCRSGGNVDLLTPPKAARVSGTQVGLLPMNTQVRTAES
jgi:hypothetical protein